MRKDIIKSLIAIKQSEIPFDVIDRDTKLPLARKKDYNSTRCATMWKIYHDGDSYQRTCCRRSTF